jgi:hypothetical protein
LVHLGDKNINPIERENDGSNQSNPSQNNSEEPKDNRLQVTVFKGGKDRPSKAEWILIGISAFLLILNIITAWYVGEQTRATKRQADISENALRFQRESDSANRIFQRNKDSIDAIIQGEKDSISLAIAEKVAHVYKKSD